MSEFIEFRRSDTVLTSFLRFMITQKAYDDLLRQSIDVDVILRALSISRNLLITKGYSDRCSIYSDKGSFGCKIKDDGLLITDFFANNFQAQNLAMKQGVNFRAGNGIVIQIKLKAYNIFYYIRNGQKYDQDPYANTNSNSTNVISDRLSLVEKDRNTDEVIDEEYQPEKKLLSRLQIAEHYAILSSEQEGKRVNEIGQISYSKIKCLEYDRVDRVAYQFFVSQFSEDLFKPGTQVDIEDDDSNRHAGEIISAGKEDEEYYLNILFNEQMEITLLPEMGWISLTYSTVVRDVQLTAIEKIKNGEAKSKYMDQVLGRNSSAGFEGKNLKDLKDKLMLQKFPPNQSQVTAISSAICAKDVFLVMGPPGTGKTTVILEWVKYFIKNENKRVLISSQNNKAVDNVLARLAEEKEIDLIRIGSESKIQSEVVPYMFENKIKALSKRIAQDTLNAAAIIYDIKKIWTIFSVQLDAVINANYETDVLEDCYIKSIKTKVIPLYNEALSLSFIFSEIRRKIAPLEQKLCVLISKIEFYENIQNRTSCILKALPYFIRKIMTKQYVAKLGRLKDQEVFTAEKYNEIYQNYILAYMDVRDSSFTSWYKKLMIRQSLVNTTKAAVPKEENKLELFSNIDIKDNYWRENRNLKSIKTRIDDEIKRAGDLIEAITEWREEIGSKQNYALNEIIMESVNLVGATCIGINSQKRFADLDFDITIIDEAGQIQIHNALVPMSVSNKLIMLGDHKQIPPSSDDKLLDICEENGVDTELLEKSLFEKMYEELPESNKIMLDIQYRMPAEIADTISEWFYDNKYGSAGFKRNLKSHIPWLSNKPFIIINTSECQNRFEENVTGSGSSNRLEADIVYRIVRKIACDSDINIKELGVITPYKKQVKQIKEDLQEILRPGTVDEMVATLDSYQGQERDIIVYSFVKSSNVSPKKRRIGFLSELRRLNVAMSRSKKTLVLIGDMSFLSSCEHMNLDDEGTPIYENSEKMFSDFIKKILMDVKDGRGEIIGYSEFVGRMEITENDESIN